MSEYHYVPSDPSDDYGAAFEKLVQAHRERLNAKRGVCPHGHLLGTCEGSACAQMWEADHAPKETHAEFDKRVSSSRDLPGQVKGRKLSAEEWERITTGLVEANLKQQREAEQRQREWLQANPCTCCQRHPRNDLPIRFR